MLRSRMLRPPSQRPSRPHDRPSRPAQLAVLAVLVPAKHSGGISGAAIALAVVAGLVALCAAAWAIARTLALEPRWTLSLRHALEEAGYRASATWAELADWARLGR